MKIIIAPTYLHTEIKSKIMKDNNLLYLNNYKFISSNNYFNELLPYIIEDNIISVNNILNKLDLKLFKSNINNIEFLKYIFNKTKELSKYNINFNELKEDTLVNYELKLMFNSINKLEYYEKYYYKLEDILKNKDFKDTIIYLEYTDIFKDKLFNIMINNNAKIYNNDILDNNKYIYKALNMSQEVECICQDIILNNYNASDINLICSSSNYYPIIEQVFNRYNIPFIINNYLKESLVVYKFISLYNLLINKDNNSLIDAIESDCFNNIDKSIMLEYIKLQDINLLDINNEFNNYHNIDLFDTNTLNILRELEDNANKYRLIILDSLNELNSDKHIFYNILNYLYKYEDIIHINKIKSVIENNAPFNNEQENLIIQLIKNIKIKHKINYDSFVNVTDLKNIVLSKEYSYVIGLDQKSYPNYSNHTGYVDETYLVNTNYIDETIRVKKHMDSLEWIHNSGNNIKYFYPVSSYDGKAKELSYYIEKLFNSNIEYYPVNISNGYNKVLDLNLSNDNLDKYILKNNELKTTAYKTEDYFSCKAKYLFKHVMKLDNRQKYNIKALSGTISHMILDDLVKNKYPKYDTLINNIEYVKHNRLSLKGIFSDCKDLVDNQIELLYKQLEEVDKQKALYFRVFAKRNIKNLDITINRLAELEKDMNYTPVSLEHKFVDEIIVDNYKIIINGIIDRIDYYNETIGVIDYKSQDKTLSIIDIYRTKKLQLITYLNHLIKEYKYNPGYAYYYCIKPYTENPVIPSNKSIKEPLFMDDIKCKNTYKGFGIMDSESIGIKLRKDKRNYISSEDIDIFFNNVELIYHEFLNQIKTKDFNAKPKTDACKYCDYNSICHYNKTYDKYTNIFDSNDQGDSTDE